MPDPKIYLNVPYAQKDAAKALGARWDASAKKWYVPPGKELALFSQWQTAEPQTAATAKADDSDRLNTANHQTAPGRTTLPAAKDFVAYDGDAPPWD